MIIKRSPRPTYVQYYFPKNFYKKWLFRQKTDVRLWSIRGKLALMET